MNEIEIEIPYIPSIGKNKMKGFRRGGGYYVQKGYKDAVAGLVVLIRAKSKGIVWQKDKIWVEIFFQKPKMKCDVSNMVDGIYDSIKAAIGIDDCYFSGKQDWEYEKNVKPYLVITIFQDEKNSN